MAIFKLFGLDTLPGVSMTKFNVTLAAVKSIKS